MKTLNILKRSGLALIAFCFMLSMANAQARYKHMPRVKIEKQSRETIIQEQNITNPTTASMINTETNTAVTTESTAPVVENTTVASTSDEVVVLETKTKSVVKHNKVVKNKRTADKDAFTRKIKENSKLMDVKDLKKSALAKWIIFMIICFAVGLVFLILAIASLYFLTYASLFLYYIFWVIAVLGFVGGTLFLILGLTGVMS